MSARRKFDNYIQGGVSKTPRVLHENLTESCKSKKQKATRPLRRTNDLFFFNSTEDGDLSKTAPPFGKRTKTVSSAAEIIDLTSPSFEKRASDEEAQLQLSIKKENTFVRTKPKLFDEDKENSLNVQKTSSPNVTNKDVKKRKIVKARRHVKAKICIESDIDISYKPRQDANIELDNLQNHKEGKSPTETLNVIVDVQPLPSPISPSANSTAGKVEDYLHFESSKEELHPSTRGSVETAKRRTYELENSITDVTLLKSISKRDSTRLSSFTSTESNISCQGNKVTQRRRWDRSDKFSPIIFAQPTIQTPILAKASPSISVEKSKRQTPIFTKASSTKKASSKVKIPNFAAIHQRALLKVENISDYKKRKDERARRLLSGLKPKSEQRNSTSGTKESRKQLRFSSGQDDRARRLLSGLKPKSEKPDSSAHRKELRFAPGTSPKEKSPTFIPLPSTPLPRRRPVVESPTPKKASPFKFTNFKPVFDFKMKANDESNSSKTRIPALKNDKKEFTRGFKHHFGFTAKTSGGNVFQQNTKKDMAQQIKSVATKSKATANTVETRRFAFKGVRSNRRFDLLMNMRKGK